MVTKVGLNLGFFKDFFARANRPMPAVLARKSCRNVRRVYDDYDLPLFEGKVGKYAGKIYYHDFDCGRSYRVYLDYTLDDFMDEVYDDFMIL